MTEFGKGLLIADGGMGTLLQVRGLAAGETPEDWNLSHPNDVATIHRDYVAAGSQVVYANTFGANRLKYRGRHALDEVIPAAIALAKRSGARVALDIGPCGRLLDPTRASDFDAAVAAFGEQVRLGAAAGADLVAIETMTDLYELKAAVVAAKENCDLPIWATVALDERGLLLTGASVECVAELLESLGVAAYGLNCGLGPDLMLPYLKRLAAIATRPLIAKPNAGLPQVVDGRTVFTVGPDEFAGHMRALVAAGATIVGGCCGTTPAHLAAVAAACAGRAASRPAEGAPRRTRITSGSQVVELKSGAGLIIGERINPTGKKALKAAYLAGDTAYVLREAVKQVEAGAVVLDVNCGVPGVDETATLAATVQAVQGVVAAPLQIDTADSAALERALRYVNGKPLVNSVNAARASMDAVFPLVKRYGGAVVALCLDEKGIPPTAEGRLALARRILAEGAKYGLGRADFVFDALTLAVSADTQAASVTLETVRRFTDELGVNTVLGVSNVSFGLPNRTELNRMMYTLARQAGLSAAIANPAAIGDSDDPAARDVIAGRDPNCAHWIARCAESAPAAVPQTAVAPEPTTSGAAALRLAVRRGLRDDARAAAAELADAGTSAMTIVSEGIVPALEEVGHGFETGKMFLPQLLTAADAAGAAFDAVRARLRGAARIGRRPVVLATVKGDVHDIGKNIVRSLLENYGFEVIDLGKDVPPETVVEAARTSGAMLVGLSALMTTTVGAMAETVARIRASGLACRTVVGGAVVTADYAAEIGADFYAADAMRTVRIAEQVNAEQRI